MKTMTQGENGRVKMEVDTGEMQHQDKECPGPPEAGR